MAEKNKTISENTPEVKKSAGKVLASNAMLFAAAIIWGSQVFFQKTAGDVLGPFSFLAGRFTFGLISLAVIILVFELLKRRRERAHGLPHEGYGRDYFRRLARIAPPVALADMAGNALFQAGIHYTSAGKAGFLSTLYIVFVPILGLILYRKKTGILTWVGLFLAVTGLYFLCINEGFSIEFGDLLVIACAFFYGLHILLVSVYVREFEGIHFTFAEFITSTVLCALVALFFEHPTLADYELCLPGILYCGLLGIGVCYALQVTGIKYAGATIAALIMSMESVFAALTGFILLGERFTGRELIGMLFLCAAIVVAQLPEPKHKEMVSK